jgi:hypothetical protein
MCAHESTALTPRHHGVLFCATQVSPGFDPASQQPLLLTAKVDDSFGTAHIRVSGGTHASEETTRPATLQGRRNIVNALGTQEDVHVSRL